MGSRVTEKLPDSSDIVCALRPVPRLRNRMTALGMTAPDASCTTPKMPAVTSCPLTGELRHSNTPSVNANAKPRCRIMFPFVPHARFPLKTLPQPSVTAGQQNTNWKSLVSQPSYEEAQLQIGHSIQ